MTGKIGELSIYRMKGCNELVVRTKGGFSKERILRDSSLNNVRCMNREWGGVTQLAGSIRRALITLAPMSDYNYTSQLCAIANRIQKSPNTGTYGERSLKLSCHKKLLTGFNLNRITPYPIVMKPSIKSKIDRLAGIATIEWPEMEPRLALKCADDMNFFRLTGVLGAVSDVEFDASTGAYLPVDGQDETAVSSISQWFSLDSHFEEVTMQLTFDKNDKTHYPSRTLLLGIGIEFDSMGTNFDPSKRKFSGAARVVEVG